MLVNMGPEVQQYKYVLQNTQKPMSEASQVDTAGKTDERTGNEGENSFSSPRAREYVYPTLTGLYIKLGPFVQKSINAAREVKILSTCPIRHVYITGSVNCQILQPIPLIFVLDTSIIFKNCIAYKFMVCISQVFEVWINIYLKIKCDY